MQIILLNWLTLAIAVSAFTYTNMLTIRGQIFDNLNDLAERHLPDWLYKPLIGCQYCVAGQWSLWFYVYFCFIDHGAVFHWWIQIWFILQTIFVTKIITELYYKILDKK